MKQEGVLFSGFIITMCLALGGLAYWAFETSRIQSYHENELTAWMELRGHPKLKAVEMTEVHVIEARISMHDADWESRLSEFLESHNGQVFFWGVSGRFTFHVAILEDGIGYELEVGL